MEVISQTLPFQSPSLLKLLQALNYTGGKPRIIGGAVRDAMLGFKSEDIDIATSLRPEEVIESLSHQGFKVIPTGINFGTVTALIDNKHFEITSLRRDIKCDGRHAEVEYTDSFEEDASRRDFTINALSYCPFEHKIYDYFGGIDDLKNKKVRFIGNASDRISEDYLRILRFFRFSACYAVSIDDAGYEACKLAKDQITRLSRERINGEMKKWLTKTDDVIVLKKMNEGGIRVFGPLEIGINNLEALYKATSFCKIKARLSTKYAMLFANSNMEDLKALLRDLLFSKADTREIMSILSIQRQDAMLALMEDWVDGYDVAQRIIASLALGKITQETSKELPHEFKDSPKALPVRGDDLKKLGIIGPDIGVALSRIKKIWMQSGCKIQKQELIRIIENEL
ncbi:MAG: CCA tRNA nucleotidyltransferase [Pseudomonadota bacterium]